jgi:c-di-GMP-binding flagellar brake protein YcgR
MLTFEERRRFKRVEEHIPVHFRDMRVGVKMTDNSLTKNLSEGGAKFHSYNFLPLSSLLMVEVTLPSTPKPVKAISSVAWIRKLPSVDEYELGVHFIHMTREDKATVSDYIHKVDTRAKA